MIPLRVNLTDIKGLFEQHSNNLQREEEIITGEKTLDKKKQ